LIKKERIAIELEKRMMKAYYRRCRPRRRDCGRGRQHLEAPDVEGLGDVFGDSHNDGGDGSGGRRGEGGGDDHDDDDDTNNNNNKHDAAPGADARLSGD
jgi:hypothetical protein